MSESSCIGHPFYQTTLFIQRDYSLVYIAKNIWLLIKTILDRYEEISTSLYMQLILISKIFFPHSF